MRLEERCNGRLGHWRYHGPARGAAGRGAQARIDGRRPHGRYNPHAPVCCIKICSDAAVRDVRLGLIPRMHLLRVGVCRAHWWAGSSAGRPMSGSGVRQTAHAQWAAVVGAGQARARACVLLQNPGGCTRGANVLDQCSPQTICARPSGVWRTWRIECRFVACLVAHRLYVWLKGECTCGCTAHMHARPRNRRSERPRSAAVGDGVAGDAYCRTAASPAFPTWPAPRVFKSARPSSCPSPVQKRS